MKSYIVLMILFIVLFIIQLVDCRTNKRTWLTSTPDTAVNEGIISSMSKSMPDMSFLSMIFPLIARILLLPLRSVARFLSQALLFIAVSAVLFSSLLPNLAQDSAIAVRNTKRGLNLPEFITRPLFTMVDSFNQIRISLNIQDYLNAGLDLLDLRSSKCRAVITCRLGSAMARDQPLVSKYMLDIAEGLNVPMDNDTRTMMDVMNKTIQLNNDTNNNGTIDNEFCDKLVAECGSIERIENFYRKFMDPRDTGSVVHKLGEAMKFNNQTTNTIGDVVFGLIKKII